MERRKLGSSELELGVLGLGCWQFGGGSYWGHQDQTDVNRIVHLAMDSGVNYFDTAEIYNDGDSETSLGIALAGRRGDAIIGSKISPSNFYPSVLRERCEGSLRRLNTDYIDLYMLHWPINDLSIIHTAAGDSMHSAAPSAEEGFQTLLDLQKEGKIRHIGLSNHGINQMKHVSGLGVPAVANELAYNLFSRAIEHGILQACRDNGLGVIAYMPLQQGLLTGKYAKMDELKPMQSRSRHFRHDRGYGARHGEDGAEREIEQALAEIRRVADDLGVHMIELSLAWVIANGLITSAIFGARNADQLALNLRAANLKLTPDIIARLSEITDPVLEKLGDNPDYYENRHASRIG